jgi:hypothetical protein
MVTRQALESGVAEQVQPAIADVDRGERIADDGGRGQGRAHGAERRVSSRLIVHVEVRPLGRGAQALVDRFSVSHPSHPSRPSQRADEAPQGGLTRTARAGQTAYPIGDGEQQAAGSGRRHDRIIVDLAPVPDIRQFRERDGQPASGSSGRRSRRLVTLTYAMLTSAHPPAIPKQMYFSFPAK